MSRLTSWCCAHHRLVAALWLLVVVAAVVAALGSDARVRSRVGPATTESQRATDLVPTVMPDGKLPDTETVVVHLPNGDLRAPAERARVEALVKRLGEVPGVGAALSPYGPGADLAVGANPISADGDTVLVAVLMKASALAPDLAAVRELEQAAQTYATAGMRVELMGPGITTDVQGKIAILPLALGGLVALLILRLALGTPSAMIAAASPVIVTTLVGLVLVGLVSRARPISPLAPVLALLLGLVVSLGAGIVVVHRAQLAMREGLDPRAAVVRAMGWAGRAAVLGAGCLCVVALVAWASDLAGFAEYAPAVFVVAAVAALALATIMPAALALGANHLLPWSERTLVRRTGSGPPRRAGLRSWWARQVGRYPRPIAIAAGVLLAVLVVPALSLRLGASDAGVDPTSTTTRRAYDLISQEYGPGLTGPMLIVAQNTSAAGPDAAARLAEAIDATPGVASAQLVLDRPDAGLALLRAIPDSEPRSQAMSDLLDRLRTQTVPKIVGDTDLRVHIGGQSALFLDTADDLAGALPVFIGLVGLVVGLAALVLARSLLVAAAIAVAELVALGAALGIVSLFTRIDWLAALLNVRTGPFEPFAVAFMVFAAFGLTVGMHLGLLSRLGEARSAARLDALRDRAEQTVPLKWPPDRELRPALRPAYRSALTAEAESQRHRELVRAGHADAAAITLTISVILFPLFLAVAAQQQRMFAVFGAGLALAVAVDALVLRGALLPGLLHFISIPTTPPPGTRPLHSARAAPLPPAPPPPPTRARGAPP
ncbi:MMPL family transporter, partial [Frankia sp. CNm7]|uniref:MMPL family transporter n=1 Tax=Frankia nepalensis TaxID=1836974 RepID=UPI001934272A